MSRPKKSRKERTNRSDPRISIAYCESSVAVDAICVRGVFADHGFKEELGARAALGLGHGIGKVSVALFAVDRFG